jgi:hypothetical protein
VRGRRRRKRKREYEDNMALDVLIAQATTYTGSHDRIQAACVRCAG